MILLRPLAWLYGGIMAIRNRLFDQGVLKETSFDLPVIGVGNLAVGGTGKTPHTEYLLHMFAKENMHAAMLSRGYGRKTHGFREVRLCTASEAGDEPYQVQQSCWHSHVYVCEDRCEGIHRILQKENKPDVIVLDDAYQHRYVKPGLNILLTDYARLYCNDHVMPEGRLREWRSGAKRADIVIITKCPEQLSQEEQNKIQQQLHLSEHQHLFFTYICYGHLRNPYREGNWLTQGTQVNAPICHLHDHHIHLLCGIAHPASLIAHFKPQARTTELLSYPDHHRFSEKDIAHIATCAQEGHIIITTEKDAARLSDYNLPKALRERLLVQPIEIRFLNNESEMFNQIIMNYVTKNTRNSSLD